MKMWIKDTFNVLCGIEILCARSQSHHHLEVRTSPRCYAGVPETLLPRPLRAFATSSALCSPVRNGKSSPPGGPLPRQHSASAKCLQRVFLGEGLPSGAWQREEISFEVLPPYPPALHKVQHGEASSDFRDGAGVLHAVRTALTLSPRQVWKVLRERMLFFLPPSPISVCNRSQDVTSSCANSFLFS